ncbi:MAG: stage II sporulation protein M [Methanosarcinaceae archaeon]|nr:stage II sporulation protein M [Methanosarcinaceae archaeon]
MNSYFKFSLPFKKVTFDFLFLSVLFLASFLIGILFYIKNPAESQEFINLLSDNLSDFNFENPYLLTLQIFFNNLSVSFYSVLFGFFLGLVPLLIITLNGFLPGLLFPYVSSKKSAFFFILGILPHGIFEIFAIILACALGFRMGRLSLIKIYGKTFGKIDISLTNEFFQSFFLYLYIVIPLLFIAAIIEVFITGFILSLF